MTMDTTNAYNGAVLAKSYPSVNRIEFGSQRLTVSRGSALPLGASVQRGGINFSLFSKHATEVTLILFLPENPESETEIPLDPRINKTGNIWHALIDNLEVGVHYGYRLDRTDNDHTSIHRFDRGQLLLDPYAHAVAGRPQWGADAEGPIVAQRYPRRSVVIDTDFDWEDDQPLNIPLADSIIYELHVRGFTRHPSSCVQHPGTFLGLTEKIPYLKSLGITAVELLPVYEFEEADSDRINPNTGERLLNYWGYHPISFFAPKASYATQQPQCNELCEFKEMIKAFHKAGIEVILDVVFNHTAEGDERGPTLSLRGIDNSIYYIIDPSDGTYHNYSGCGNTVNCNHPVVRDLIMDSLHYWVTEMHVDGFRFDLASILGRGRDGSVLPDPPLLERIAEDPVLANTKIIAEAWDAAGLYQVGSFPAWSRWAEWNGKFRDDIRRFVRGDPGMVPALAMRLTGSADLYQTSDRHPYHSINFITCHDGFTLADVVSYNEKHNLENGENGRDGHNDNLSWNCGVEGPTDVPEISALRARQTKNMAVLLLLAHGVPMILSGDEMGNSQRGNNNAYCQDNEISWLDWEQANRNEGLVRFFRLLIQFRRQYAVLRRESFLPDNSGATVSVEWHGVKSYHPDWSYHCRTLAKCLRAIGPDGAAENLYLAMNAYWESLTFELPVLEEQQWHRVMDTSLIAPLDIVEPGCEEPLTNSLNYEVSSRSMVLLVGK